MRKSISHLSKNRAPSMAANKFATNLHQNTNKFTLILTYAMLEWILIILLLFNSLFSYLILKFANYFGLKKPCFLCSRIDHIFEPNKNSYKDIVCEIHSTEMGYCLNHKKLAKSQEMGKDWIEFSKLENGDVGLNTKLFLNYFLIKPNWEIVDYTQRWNSIFEERVGDEILKEVHLDQRRSDFLNEERRIKTEELEDDDLIISIDDSFQEIVPQQHFEFVIDQDDYELIPVKSIDSITMENESQDFVLDFDFLVEKSIEFGENKSNPGCEQDEFLGNEVFTIEKLKLELRNERKALNASYEELEEERNASEIALNETMAMINRLQEEKAKIKMEALQYQRTMDEQIEYDQEALKILNKIIVEKEKEKEKELELYRKRVGDYEAKEMCKDGDEMGNEDERMLILEQLQILEEKLFRLNDEDDCDFEQELDCGYERLEVIEANLEFLRQCMNSLKKGDEGVTIVHEILQLLRELRKNVRCNVVPTL